MKLGIVVDGMKQFNLGFGVFFAGAFGKHAFGSAVFNAITRSASHFTNCIWHISYTIQKIDFGMFLFPNKTLSNKSNRIKCLNTWEEFCAQDSSAQDSSAQDSSAQDSSVEAEDSSAIIIQRQYINLATASTL